VSGEFPALEPLGVGWDPRLWPGHAETAQPGLLAC
jgi:hypothetical protein